MNYIMRIWWLQVTSMLHRGIVKANLDAKKLREALEKTKKHIKIEREIVQSRAKIFKQLEKKNIQLGSSPKDAEHVTHILEDKDK